MNAQERIKKLLDYSKLNASELAEKLGVKTKQTVYDILSGKTKGISESMRVKILSCFPEINLVWLMTGNGEMLNDAKTVHIAQNIGGDNNGNMVAGNYSKSEEYDSKERSELAVLQTRYRDLVNQHNWLRCQFEQLQATVQQLNAVNAQLVQAITKK